MHDETEGAVRLIVDHGVHMIPGDVASSSSRSTFFVSGASIIYGQQRQGYIPIKLNVRRCDLDSIDAQRKSATARGLAVPSTLRHLR
jgi:hypothetical protein